MRTNACARLVLLATSLLGGLAACVEPGTIDDTPDAVGRAEVEITTVPTGVQCLQIVTSAGGVASKQQFPVTAGTPATLTLGKLPLGSVSLVGEAYDATCATVTGGGAAPSWISDTVVAQLKPGALPRLAFQFRRYNPATGTTTFDDTVVDASLGAAGATFGSHAVMADGRVMRFFTGTTTAAPPSAVAGVNDAVAVAQGQGVSLMSAFACVITTSGGVRCWGDSLSVFSAWTTPTLVPGLPAGARAVKLVAGEGHACVLADDGGVYCIGHNTNGQLGSNGTPATAFAFTKLLASGLTDVAAGKRTTCVRNSAGQVLCSGDGTSFANGLSPATTVYIPNVLTSVSAAGGVRAGGNSGCALRADGVPLCWGDNSAGQLGDGTSGARAQAAAPSGIVDVIDVAVGGDAICWLRSDGTVRCAGNNASGQLGNGTAATSLTAVQAKGLTGVVKLVASSARTCALRDNGSLWCWGAGTGSANGQAETRFVPTPVQF